MTSGSMEQILSWPPRSLIFFWKLMRVAIITLLKVRTFTRLRTTWFDRVGPASPSASAYSAAFSSARTSGSTTLRDRRAAGVVHLDILGEVSSHRSSSIFPGSARRAVRASRMRLAGVRRHGSGDRLDLFNLDRHADASNLSSPPVRGRGLKPRVVDAATQVARSPPVRGRGLKQK